MKVFIVSCVLLSVAFAQQAPQTLLHECFEQDSIACVQNTVYRQAREFFNQPTIKLFGGVAFAKTNERAGKALAPEVEKAETVQAREIALEGYLAENVKSFFTDRQLTWDLATAGRSLANAIPDDVKETVRELVVEGRTKKKILKKLIPILGLVKLKALGLAVLTVAAIGLIAKKALITSFIAIAIASASALSSIVAKLFSLGSGLSNKSGGLGSIAGAFSGGLGGAGGLGGLGGLGAGGAGGSGGYNNAQVEEYIINSQSGGNGWPSANSGWSNSYDHEHGAYSQPIGQAIAYSGHKANRR